MPESEGSTKDLGENFFENKTKAFQDAVAKAGNFTELAVATREYGLLGLSEVLEEMGKKLEEKNDPSQYGSFLTVLRSDFKNSPGRMRDGLTLLDRNVREEVKSKIEKIIQERISSVNP